MSEPMPGPVKRKKYDAWEHRAFVSGEAVELWDAALGDYNPDRIGVVEHSAWEEDAVQYVTEYRVRLGRDRVVMVAPDELRPAGSA